MNISIIGPSKKFFSGLSAYTICLANALSKSNEVSVVLLRNLLPRFLYPGKGHLGRQDYSLDFLPAIKTYDGLDWNSPRSWFRAYRFLKRQGPEVIVMQWWTSSVVHMQLFLAIANRLRIKARLILEMHEIVDPLEESILPIRLYSRIMGRLLMNRADAFVVHSASVKDKVAEIYHLSQDKISVIPHGLYEHYQRDYAREAVKQELGIKEEFVILYFGLIRKYKGVPYLVEAFDKLPQDIARYSRLIIAGEDWGDETSLAGRIDSSPYREQITYKPEFVPDGMIPKYFSAADVVVLPYLRTAGSGVASIAMAHGKPMITSDLETMRECLAGYEGAVFVPPGDSAAISERLLEMYGQCQSGKSMIYSPPQNTWDEIARQYEGIIAKISGRLSRTEREVSASPKVSIVVLNWNGGGDVIECLKSVRDIDYPDYEIIVVDNGSTDGSVAEIGQKFPDIKVIENSENLGFAEGNNVGIRAATGDYIMLLNQDTVAGKSMLKDLVQVMEADDNIGIVGPMILYYDEPDKIWCAGSKLHFAYASHIGKGARKEFFTRSCSVDYIAGCAMLVKKEVLNKIGLLASEYFLYFEDADFCLRARKAGYKCVYVPSPTVWHKATGEWITNPTQAYYYMRNAIVFAKRALSGLKEFIFIAGQFFLMFPYNSLRLAARGKFGLTKHLFRGLRDGAGYSLFREPAEQSSKK